MTEISVTEQNCTLQIVLALWPPVTCHNQEVLFWGQNWTKMSSRGHQWFEGQQDCHWLERWILSPDNLIATSSHCSLKFLMPTMKASLWEGNGFIGKSVNTCHQICPQIEESLLWEVLELVKPPLCSSWLNTVVLEGLQTKVSST